MPLDPVVVGQLRELGGESLVRKLFQTFVDYAPERRAAIERAAEARDRESLGVAVHSLRSSSAMLGARELSRLAAELETLADEGRVDELIGNLPRLTTSMDQVLGWLAEELGPATPAE